MNPWVFCQFFHKNGNFLNIFEMADSNSSLIRIFFPHKQMNGWFSDSRMFKEMELMVFLKKMFK